MPPRTGHETRQREPLTRDRVLRSAIELADAGGLESLTMRKLARALGVEAMSLYHHATNKDAILDGIADLIVSEIELPSAEGDWKAAVRATAISAHRVLRRHPWACPLLMSAARAGPRRFRMIDAILGRLGDAGFAPGLLDLTYHAVDGHILGFTLWEAGYVAGAREVPPDFAAVAVERLGLLQYPNIMAHVAFHHGQRDPNRTDQQVSAFEFGLDLILDGAERLRAEGGVVSPRSRTIR